MLQVFAGSNLTHQPILVTIHSRQLAHVIKGILQPVRQLVSIDVRQSELYMGINHEFGQAQNLSHEMKGVSKPGFLSFLGCQSLGWLQIEVVVQVKVLELLAVDEQIEYVVTLLANLETSFHPVEFGALKEFRALETLEECSFAFWLLRPRVQLIEYPSLQQLLIRYPDLGRILEITRDSLTEPVSDERNINGASSATRSCIERIGRRIQRNARIGFGSGERFVG
mmetsp:Transcript_24864/g.68548  ORF Transcript_24864/g.68548 Transcript_24864/m.68548 type:complete len:225 (+) Transcript_24864:1077-1751(+)